MLKHRIVNVAIAVVLLLTAIGAAGITTDALSYLMEMQVYACNEGSGAGGGC